MNRDENGQVRKGMEREGKGREGQDMTIIIHYIPL